MCGSPCCASSFEPWNSQVGRRGTARPSCAIGRPSASGPGSAWQQRPTYHGNLGCRSLLDAMLRPPTEQVHL